MTTSTPNHPAVLPLLTTTASLATAIYETIVYRGFIKSLPVTSSTGPFTDTDRHAVARTISLWWRKNIPEGLSYILLLGMLSLGSGIRAVRKLGRYNSEWWLAVLGTTFAVAHFGFAPAVSKVIEGMAFAYERAGIWHLPSSGRSGYVDYESEKSWRGLVDVETEAEVKYIAAEEGRSKIDVVDDRVIELQKKWLRIHYWRTLTVDMPAALCFGWLTFRKR